MTERDVITRHEKITLTAAGTVAALRISNNYYTPFAWMRPEHLRELAANALAMAEELERNGE